MEFTSTCCKNCGTNNDFFVDYKQGTTACKFCGLIIEDQLMNMKDEYLPDTIPAKYIFENSKNLLRSYRYIDNWGDRFGMTQPYRHLCKALSEMLDKDFNIFEYRSVVSITAGIMWKVINKEGIPMKPSEIESYCSIDIKTIKSSIRLIDRVIRKCKTLGKDGDDDNDEASPGKRKSGA